MRRCRPTGFRVRPAFTLIELIVVLLVLGILAAIAIVAVPHFTTRAQRTAEDATMRNIGTAVLVAYTAAGDAGPLTRDLVVAALEDAFSVEVVDEGVQASTTWTLTDPDTPPVGTGQYSVAFDSGTGDATISDTSGARALIATQSRVPGREIVAAVVTVGPTGDTGHRFVSLCFSDHHTGAGPVLGDLEHATCGDSSAPVYGGGDTLPLIEAAQNVTVTPGDGILEVEWDAAAGATSYTVTALHAPDPSPVAECHTEDTTCTLTDLTNGVEHTVLVTAHGPANSAVSDPVTATPLPGAPTTAPQVTVAAVTYTTARFTWAPVTGQDVTGYQVEHRIGTQAWTRVDVADATEFTVGPVAEGSAVQARPRAQRGRTGPWSAAVTAQLPVAPPEGAPTVTTSTVTHTQATFTWTSVPRATTYYVGVRCNSASWTYSTQTSRSKTVTCQQGDTAAISVRARNAGGDSAASTATAALTIATPPAPTTVTTWTEVPTIYMRADGVTCPAGTVIQSRSRHRWNSDSWGSWSAWVDSGKASQSATYTSTTAYYDNVSRRQIQVRCANAATGRVSAASASVEASTQHAMPSPTGLTVQVGGTGETWRAAKWSATCAPQTSVRYGYNIQAATFTASENMTTKTSFSRTEVAWGSGTINVAAVCVSPGGRIGPQVNVKKNF